MAIEILKPEVIDQIAAGEVLERPSNLLKELIENSLDAGADDIEVSFDNGGRSVSVIDNGSGMGKADLELCLLRHATSKIVKSSDLFALASYGFRGEALASIAGVGDVTIVSRTGNEREGHRITCQFGSASQPVAVAAKKGTQIHVRELFANVPARLEFLKSEAAEHGNIKQLLKAMALARPEVAFRALNKNELVLHWDRARTFTDRAREVLQNKNLVEAKGEVAGIRVEAAVGSPRETQAVNRNLWFFVQGRWVQDRSLAAAVMEAYRNLLMHGEFPMAAVKIELAPGDVDVNVHPTKSAVKFKNPSAVFRAVSSVIRTALEKAPWLDSAPKAEVTFAEPEQKSYTFEAPEFQQVQYSTKSFPLAEVREAIQQAYVPEPVMKFAWGDLQVVGQVNLTYVVAQSADSFYLVDQHAAHERVVFERLMQSFHSGKMDVQSLLLPLAVDLSEAEAEALVGEAKTFEKLGLQLERLGPQSIAVQTLPSLIQESAVVEALKKAAHELTHNSGPGAVERRVADLFATMACHSVVRAGQALSMEQMQQLLKQMDEFPLSGFCPHGRPVFVQRRFQDIEREFGRIN